MARSGRVALYFRDDVRLAGPPPSNAKLDVPAGEIHDLIRERLQEAPAFWIDLVAELEASPEELQEALWDLAWAGEATNDAFAPLRARRLSAVKSAARRGRRFSSRRTGTTQTVQGRWSLTASLFRGQPDMGPRMRAQAELLLERYGIVTRETVLAEGIPGGLSTLYGELSNLEMLGSARRGYFVEGQGGAQFALAGAVERLRSLPRVDDEYLVLAVTDPANPYGASLSWPKRRGRPPSRAHRGRLSPHAERQPAALRRARRPRDPAVAGGRRPAADRRGRRSWWRPRKRASSRSSRSSESTGSP